MTTLQDRSQTALLVVDVQQGVVEEAYERDRTVANVRSLVDRARSSAAPVVWVQHSDPDMEKGSAAWQLVPELTPEGGEPLVDKLYGDSFEATDLEEVLSDLAVGRLVVCGASTDICIRSTIHGAFARGYDVTLVGDAHTTDDLSSYGAPTPDLVIAHTNLYWSVQKAPGRTASTVDAGDVDFAGAATLAG